MKKALTLLAVLAVAGAARAADVQAPVGAAALDSLPEMTIDEVVAAVLANSPDLEAAKHRVAQAEEGLDQAWAALWPQLSVSGTYTHFNKEVSFASFVLQPQDTLGMQVELTVPLLVMPAYYGIAQVKRMAEASRLSSEYARQQLIFGTRNFFWSTLGAQEILRIARAAEAQSVKHTSATRVAREAGAATALAVTQAELLAVKAEQDRIQAEEQYRILVQNLAIMMGRPPARPKKADLGPPITLTASQALALAQENRNDYRAAIQMLESARRQQAGARFSYVPTVTARANYLAQTVQNTAGDKTSWTAMLIARWVIFDGLSRESKVSQSASAVAEQEASLRSKRMQMTQEINNALMLLTKANAQAATSRKQVELAKQNADALDLAYTEGAATNLEYNDAMDGYVQAQIGLASSELQVAMARNALEQAMGCPEGCVRGKPIAGQAK